MSQRTRARRIEALEELRESLNLESLPVRIECFDISNLGDANPVASMVVFEDAVAKRSDYRKFGMRHTGGQDDFAMMHEAVGRRFARMTTVDADALRRQLRRDPEPGGDRRRQGAAGRRAGGDGEHDLPRVAVVSLAKRDEEVFVPGRPDPIRAAARLGRPAAAAADPRRGPPVRARRSTAARRGKQSGRLDLQHAARRRARPKTPADAALPHGRRAARGVPRRSSRRCPACRPRSAAASTTGCTRRGSSLRRMPLIPEDPPQVELSPSRRRRASPRVVCLGGGTGLSMILRGLKRAAA